ncbi:MAG: iron-containing redox enzyme family protein [Thermoproteota archaeon]|nr:iron-containing redox enzyme family protein [Thermoproteota archaeon]
MSRLVDLIDVEIQNRSLLKHPFYQKWSNGELILDHLQGYSKEYSQLVNAIPKMVENVVLLTTDKKTHFAIAENQKEESEHIELWAKFAGALGVSKNVLSTYGGSIDTNLAISKLIKLTSGSFEEAVCAMYAYEMELPKISRSKIDGLKGFYNITGSDATEYFRTHEEVDVRHAQLWRRLINDIPKSKHDLALKAAIRSLEAQNDLLDAVCSQYLIPNN